METQVSITDFLEEAQPGNEIHPDLHLHHVVYRHPMSPK